MIRRIITSLSALVLLCLGLDAQELKVADIRPLESSIKARTAQVRDNNGDLCALLEIAAPSVEGLVFDQDKTVGEASYSAGVYSVFVPAGTKKLGFRHRDYVPGTIDFDAAGIKIESGATYFVSLQKPSAGEAEYQFLVINVKPTSALVEVDGQSQVVTNGTVQMLLPVGTVHHYKVSGNGMQTEEGDAVINSADEKTTVDISLRAYSTKVHISSVNGASIRLNGNVMGRGEWTGDITPGTYRIEAVLDGTVISNDVYDIAMSDTVQDITLEVLYGTVTITSSVPNASVSIDGEPKGVTPLRLTKIIPGKHNVKVSLDGYKDYSATVQVEPSRGTEVTAALVQLPQPKVMEKAAAADKAEKPSPEPKAQKAPKEKAVKEPGAPKAAKAPSQAVTLVMADAGFAPGSGELSYGVMAGWVKDFGGYVRYRSSFNGISAQYTAGGGKSDAWLDGTVSTSRTLFSAGGLVRLTDAVYPYAGIGFGSRNAYGKVPASDGSDKWASMPDFTYSGAAVEAGVVLRLGKVAISLGANCTAFKYTDIDLGVGITF